jgi:hypothetical protein
LCIHFFADTVTAWFRVLPQLLQMLTGGRLGAIALLGSNTSVLNWEELPTTIKASLGKVFRSQNVLSIRLHHVTNFSAAQIATCPQLKRMWFIQCSVSPGLTYLRDAEMTLDEAPTPPMKTGQLVSLYVVNKSRNSLCEANLVEAMEHPNAFLGISKLHEFMINEICLDPGTGGIQSRIMCAASQSLKTVAWLRLNEHMCVGEQSTYASDSQCIPLNDIIHRR